MSEQKRSAEEQIADEADRKARNPTAARQKISEGQTAPEFHQNREKPEGRATSARGRAEDEKMRAARLKELEEMAADLLATARKLLPGQDRHNALQEIARFRARIIGLHRQALRSAHRKQKSKKS